MPELIRIDVIEHPADSSTVGSKSSSDKAAKRENVSGGEKVARERAKSLRRGMVVGLTLARKAVIVGTEIANQAISLSYQKQIFDASIQGDNRKAQLLQNRKNIVQSSLSFASTQVSGALSTATAFFINPYLGAVQLATQITQLGTDIVTKYLQFEESMRQYQLEKDKSIKMSEYQRGRLLENTYYNRGRI